MIDTFMTVVLILFATVFLATAPSLVSSIRLYRRRYEFKCSLCGNCCRFKVTPVTGEDVARMESADLSDFTEYRSELCMKRVNGRCIFLEDDKCRVHDLRPRVCREFPFFREYGIGYTQKASFCPALEELEDG